MLFKWLKDIKLSKNSLGSVLEKQKKNKTRVFDLTTHHYLMKTSQSVFEVVPNNTHYG